MTDKKEVKKKESEKAIGSKKEIKKKQNKQIMWVIILMACLIAIIILVPFIKNNFINKFTYINLDFQKTQLGDLKYYSTRIPIADNETGKITGSYSMNFKNDPRKSGRIEFNTQNKSDSILFNRKSTVYITLNPEMETCGAKNIIAFSDLSGFLGDFAGLKVQSGVTEKNYSIENKITYVTCQNNPKNTVIYINSGNKTEINKINDHCYELIYNDCEVLPVTEQFMLIIMEKYMSYFTKKDSSFLNMFKNF